MSIRYALFGTPANPKELVDYATKNSLGVVVEADEVQSLPSIDGGEVRSNITISARSGNKRVYLQRNKADVSNERMLDDFQRRMLTRAQEEATRIQTESGLEVTCGTEIMANTSGERTEEVVEFLKGVAVASPYVALVITSMYLKSC